VVGDDAQSIYSFRGALIENILNFKNDYPSFQLFKLEQNYRSTQNIVDAANSIIEKNRSQIRKTVYSKNETGNKISVVKALTDVEEGFKISNSILDTMLQERLLFNDFAILYRTNAQSRIFEEALRKRNIPYKIYGSISFYQRKEIKDLISYLRILINPNDDEALKRIINYPARGIGNTTLEKLEEISNQNNIGIWQVIEELRKNPVVFNKGTLHKLFSFADLIAEFQVKAQNLDAFEVAMNMASASGIMKELNNGNAPEERSKYENLEELLNGIHDFTNTAKEEGQSFLLQDYLENIALLTDADNEKSEDKEKVSIMTIHAAKGLEFSHIYIAGVEEELFPSEMSLGSARDLEEERRLFYVAVTRAKKNVTISYSQLRYKWGVPNNCVPSRFIKDIDEKFIDWPDQRRTNSQMFEMQEDNLGGIKTYKPGFTNTLPSGFKRKSDLPFNPKLPQNHPSVSAQNFVASDPSAIQLGMLIEHQRFGLGKVIHIEGTSPDKKATVFFQEMKQEKQLLLKFAKLRIVENI
jgi:DNA helicase-2/ATP-dependent DNA helicase PcrA